VKQLRAPRILSVLLTAVLLLDGRHAATAFQKPDNPGLPNFDQRSRTGAAAKAADARHQAAVAQLKAQVREVTIELHPVLGTPKWVAGPNGFLSGRNGVGRGISPVSAAGFAGDPHRITKAFLKEHKDLFGHGPEALATARVRRQFIDGHNGMKTMVWQQQLDDIDVFEGVLKTHTTRNGELVNISSHFVGHPDEAANRGHVNRAALQAAPVISAKEAVASAAQNLGERLGIYQLSEMEALPQGAEKRQQFRAVVALRGPAHARLVWLPLDSVSMRLCWEVILSSRARGEMFRVLIDSETGEALLRHCLTAYISPATYRVFTSDSPSPFSPGHSTPSSIQPPVVERSLVTLDALNTNASPAGWINDGQNETRGNNVDAHTDHDNDDFPDTPRPQGSPARTFDFPMNVQTDSPFNYSPAAVVQLFYWNNWMHDRLYELGFTEAAGNFQDNNFVRGGEEADAVQADAQDGGGFNNANMSTPPDGLPARMQMYLFDNPTPFRDGDLDAEIILHEYTHGLSNRRVGGGVGISELQSAGLGEGWSDFYGLALLAEAGDDLNGNWAAGGFLTFQFLGLTENYYFGIRRYPYSTDLTKNPLTFRDIDPIQASAHPGIPINPIFSGINDPSEVHSQGEVWCVVLWEVRANLIRKHGFSVGNELTLQLVTDGMNLSPADPNFVQARDAIIQADQVLTGGANHNEVWAGFAKRGLGLSASSPDSSITLGVVEAFDVPDDLVVSPAKGFSVRGAVGGPFKPHTQMFSLTNVSTNILVWTASTKASWLTLSNTSGTLAPGAPADVMGVSINAAAFFLEAGIYTEGITFSNHTTHVTQTRQITLSIGQPDFLTEQLDHNETDLQNQTLTFTPDGSPGFYAVCREPATAFPTNPRRGKLLYIGHDDYTLITLAGAPRVSLFGESTNGFYVGANGYVSFGSPDLGALPSLQSHFTRRRVSGLFAHLEGANAGNISWQQLADRVALTYEDVVDYSATNTSSFQIELFYDGRIRLTHLHIGARTAIVGLSRGHGVPAGFFESDLSAYDACAPRLVVSMPEEATEGDGTLAGQGRVTLPGPVPAAVTVTLSSSDTSEVMVPAMVVVPAGQTNAAFNLLIVDDADFDGTQNAIISVSAPQYNTGSGTLSIHDNEAGVLALNLPASAGENTGTVQGTVSVIAAVAGDIVVNLSSSLPSLVDVPPFVLISSGTNSAVFTGTLFDDARINGTRTVQIMAHVQNWPDGMGSIDILDNENLNLTLTVPAQVSEVSGLMPGAGQVSISGTLGTNMLVSLFSSDTTELIVPPTATIPAGNTNVTFDLTAVDDNGLDGNQTVMITASSTGFNDGSVSLMVMDDETPAAPSNPRPPDLSSNITLNVELGWSSTASELVANGDFETGDLTGWSVENLGNGLFRINDGTVDPDSPDDPLPPYAGRYNAFTDQVGGGRHTLYQEVRIPNNVTSATLRWAHRIRNHAAIFSEGQRFRVEIRGTDNTVLGVAFSTQPGDAALQDWVERSFDLGAYRGQTIRIAFAEQDNLFYFNAHVDNVSVKVTSPNPPVFDVYFGTNPTPGPAQFLATATNNSWHLPPLAPSTTYYWQVVARRVGLTPSPVWRFTTRGVDRFEWGPVATTQHVGASFAATLTARDELNGVVSNFTRSVAFSVVPAVEPRSYTMLESFQPEELSSGLPRTYGYSFTPYVDLVVTHLRSYAGQKVSLWSDLGTLLVSVDVTAAPGSWTETLLPSPLNLEAGRPYVIGFYVTNDTLYIDYSLPGFFPHGSLDQSYCADGDSFPITPASLQWVLVDFRYVVGPALSVPITPTISGNFINGSWTGNLALLASASNVALRAHDSEGHTGLSNPFQVRGAPGAVDYFAWSDIPSPQIINIPVAATLAAHDSFGNVVSNFSGPVSIFARRDLSSTSIGTGTNRSVYPMATFFRNARSQVIYLASELGGPQSFEGLSLHVATPPGQSLKNWTLRMKHTVLSSYGASPVWESDWTTVFEGDVAVTSPGWAMFTFSTPFDYDGQRNVMIDFTFQNGTFTFDGECYVTATPAARSINLSADDGNPIFWSGDFPLPEIYREIPNLQLHPFNPPIMVVPSSAASFSNGLWSGNITIAEPATALRLHAVDDHGHSGQSNPFDVGLRDDIAVSVVASPTLVAIEDTLTYTICVTNTGPSAATGVTITNLLPSGISMVSVTASQGSCSIVGSTVRCNLGTVDGPGKAIVTITCVPTTETTLLNRTHVTRVEPDFYLPNNAITNLVTAERRYLAVSNPSVREGDNGTTNAVFELKLSVPAAHPITVDFATSDLSASADIDYVATNGAVVFNPGESEAMVAVSVMGDLLYEEDEVFGLDVSAPPNAHVTILSSGYGGIGNDDDPPSLVLHNASVVEGQSGTTNAVFRLDLSKASGLPVTLSLYTVDTTAQAGVDYFGTNIFISFDAGQTNTNIVVVVIGDTVPELDETFRLEFDSVAGAAQDYRSGIGTILSDDIRPLIVADRATLVSEANTNGVIDPGEMVTVSFALRNIGSANTTNLMATLLATGGVTAPSGPQTYGVVPLSGTPVIRPFTFTANGTNGGTLTATLQLQDGGASLSNVTFAFTLGPVSEFRIVSLSTNGCLAIEHGSLTGDDHGGIAASSSHVFYTGDNGTARFSLSDLSGAAAAAALEAVTSDLRTETVYVFGNGTQPLPNGGGVANRLLEINGSTGAFTSNSIPLSTSILLSSGSGLFAGYGRIAVHNGSRVYRIALPSGIVSDLGPMSMPQHNTCETWAFWGVTEEIEGSTWLAYVFSSSILRTRVPDGLTQTVRSFLNLGDMCCFTVSLSRNRWYFHHEGFSQFRTGDETIGYCDATFSLGRLQRLDHFEWNPVEPVRPWNMPFPVTIRAIDNFSQVMSNFTGTVKLSAQHAGLLGARSILGSPLHDQSTSGNFTLGYAFRPNTNITVTHVRHYSGSKVSLWTDSGTLLTSVPVSSQPGVWAETRLLTPVVLNANTRYRVGVYSGNSAYYWRNNLSGVFVDGAIEQSYNASGDGFPSSSDNSRWWFVDLRYAVGSLGTVPITPTNSGNFVNGVWSGNVTVQQPGSNIVLLADDGALHSGVSNPFRVTTNTLGAVDHFVWNAIGATQFVSAPFGVTITARDELDNVVTSFAGTVTLSAAGLLPASFVIRGNPEPEQVFTGDFTLGFAFTPAMDVAVTHFRHYSGARVSIWSDNGAVLASRIVTNAPGTWNETPLVSPVPLTAGTRYRVGFLTDSGPYFRRFETVTNFTHGSIDGSFYAVGDQVPNNAFADGWWLVDLRFQALGLAPIAVQPPGSGNFMNGVWSGSLTVTQTAANLTLWATDNTGHAGESNPFQVIPGGPRLFIARDGNRAVITWSAATADFVLESASMLGNSSAWLPTTNQVHGSGNLRAVTNTISGAKEFYRLRRP